MRVLFVAHSFPRAPGDAPGSFLLRLARALRDEEVHVRVLAPSAPGLTAAEELDGVPVRRFRYAPGGAENLAYGGNMAELVRTSWGARLALLGFLGASHLRTRALVREHRPHVVHAHWWFPGGLTASWAVRGTRVPLVTTLHGTDVRLARDVAPARRLFRGVLARSRTVTAVSRWLAAQAATLQGGPPPLVAPMPVAAELFEPGEAAGRDRLLFVGRLTRQKGVDRLLRALAAMRRRVPLDVVGDGPEAEPLRALAGELGIADRVRWLGALVQQELAAHYRRALALAVTSREEGLGLVAVEAMLCGTPVVAFDSGGIVDVVRHDVTGLLVPPDDVAALARALDRIVAPGAADVRGRLGAAGRAIALETFAPAAVARRYADVYRAAAGDAAP